jgi:hypothetical protein
MFVRNVGTSVLSLFGVIIQTTFLINAGIPAASLSVSGKIFFHGISSE